MSKSALNSELVNRYGGPIHKIVIKNHRGCDGKRFAIVEFSEGKSAAL